MTTTKWFPIAAALAAVTLVGAGCLGHPPGRDPEAMKRFVAARVDDLLDDVDVTDAQRTQIHAIEERLVAEAGKLRADHAGVKQEALQQLTAETPDAARLHALVDGRVDAFRAFAHQAVDGILEARAVLTPEQRARLDQKLRRHLEE